MYDVIIIGGGPAGLSAALVLGRCRRQVLVYDAGHPRNAAAKAMHGFISREGIAPAEFLAIAREQLSPYTSVEVRAGVVSTVERDGQGFRVKASDGSECRTRFVLLATGIIDDVPDLPGIAAFYGKSVHHCPYCDGWEHRDGAVAVYGRDTEAAELAIELLGWTSDVVVCADGMPCWESAMEGQLLRVGIRVVETRVTTLEGSGEQLSGIRFEDGSFLEREALFFSPGQKQHSPFAQQLGCGFDRMGFVECGPDAATCVPGIYAAGNASKGLQLVIIAAAEGTMAAFSINQALLKNLEQQAAGD